MTFRTRLFLSALAAAVVTLAVGMLLVSWSLRRTLDEEIQTSLVNQTRLAAETLSHRQPAGDAELDAEADALGQLVHARVTFVGADGRVVGDSDLTATELHTLENHATRPEIVAARERGLGIARRYSATLRADMLYVAVPVRGPAGSGLDVVRMALPLTSVNDQIAALRRPALVAFGAGLATALALALLASHLLGRRLRDIAAVAGRYAAGDFSRASVDYGTDEIGVVARALDHSAREAGRRAAELESDRARMEAILSGMIEGVLVVDDHGRVQLVNDAARRLLRLQEGTDGRHYLEIVRQPDIAAQIGATLQGQTPAGLELPLPRDPERTVIARSAPVRSPAAGGAVLVMHDITDLRRADRIRRDFVANVSHELRTPLTAVRGYVEALMDSDVESDEAHRFLGIIERHTQRMERLVRDLLRLARLDAGQEPIDVVTVPVEALFSGVETELARTLDERGQRVARDIAPGADAVRGDPAKLHDALRNLVENASNYSPAGSTIRLAAARAGDRIELSVTDQGPGIPEAERPRIFERFYRVDKARSRGERDPGGTGLGLAIVKHLIELHDGHVTMTGARGGGSVFTIDLPV